ncbi:MAG: glycosyltransferase family 2 protein [Bacteroidota bacterium]
MTNTKPAISICIPAYKRVDSLKRLFDSIKIQTFNDFEVIITDDSPDDSVRNLAEIFKEKISLKYFKNIDTLGTPANWNACIDMASGEWIKIMHDDDWFANENSLALFAARINDGGKFIFCNYLSIDEENKVSKKSAISNSWKTRITEEPYTLYAKNMIGPPSVTLIHTSIMEKFDTDLKWLVDVDFYISVLSKEKKIIHINEPLISIGLSETQVTNACFLNPLIELPEGLRMLEKNGLTKLKNIWVYDAWWRLFRNMQIKNEAELEQYVPRKWPAVLVSMLNDQKKYPSGLLKNGFFSKALCFFLLKKTHLESTKFLAIIIFCKCDKIFPC